MKPTVVKTLNKYHMSHASVGDLSSLLIDCMKEGTEFLLHYYGQRKMKNLSEAKREYKNSCVKIQHQSSKGAISSTKR